MADRSFAAQLHRESEAWVVEGIVTPEQAAAIRSRYADAQGQRRASATTALAVIGGVAVGVGVLAFVAACGLPLATRGMGFIPSRNRALA